MILGACLIIYLALNLFGYVKQADGLKIYCTIIGAIIELAIFDMVLYGLFLR